MECKCCPVFNTFNIIGKKFSLLILRNMLYVKQKRFNEFLNSIEGINPKHCHNRLEPTRCRFRARRGRRTRCPTPASAPTGIADL